MGIDGILNLYTQQIVRFQAEELRNICFPFFFFSRSQRQNSRPEVSVNLFFPTRSWPKKILKRIYLLVA